MVVKIERITPHTNFGGVRCGSFGLAIFTDISATTVTPTADNVGDRVMAVGIVMTVGPHRLYFPCNGAFGSIMMF